MTFTTDNSPAQGHVILKVAQHTGDSYSGNPALLCVPLFRHPLLVQWAYAFNSRHPFIKFPQNLNYSRYVLGVAAAELLEHMRVLSYDTSLYVFHKSKF